MSQKLFFVVFLRNWKMAAALSPVRTHDLVPHIYSQSIYCFFLPLFPIRFRRPYPFPHIITLLPASSRPLIRDLLLSKFDLGDAAGLCCYQCYGAFTIRWQVNVHAYPCSFEFLLLSYLNSTVLHILVSFNPIYRALEHGCSTPCRPVISCSAAASPRRNDITNTCSAPMVSVPVITRWCHHVGPSCIHLCMQYYFIRYMAHVLNLAVIHYAWCVVTVNKLVMCAHKLIIIHNDYVLNIGTLGGGGTHLFWE